VRVTTGSTDPALWVGHVIVCGLHDEGLRIIEQLHASGVLTVAVDDEPDPRLVAAATALGVPITHSAYRSSPPTPACPRV